MKKIIATMIATAACASLIGCGATDWANTDNTQETSVTNEVNVSEGSNEERDYGLSQETSDLLAKWNIHPMFGKLLEDTPVIGLEFLRVSTEEEIKQLFGEEPIYEVADGVGILFYPCIENDEDVIGKNGKYYYNLEYVNIADGWSKGSPVRVEYESKYLSSLDFARVTTEQMEQICTFNSDKSEFSINEYGITYEGVVDALGCSGQISGARKSGSGEFISVQWYDTDLDQMYLISFEPRTGTVRNCMVFNPSK